MSKVTITLPVNLYARILNRAQAARVVCDLVKQYLNKSDFKNWDERKTAMIAAVDKFEKADFNAAKTVFPVCGIYGDEVE